MRTAVCFCLVAGQLTNCRLVLRQRLERLVNSSPMIMRLGGHRGTDKQHEALGAFGATALHAAATHQHRDAPLDAGTEALALLERRRSFVSPALRRLAATALRNAHRSNAAARANGEVVLAEEAAIGAVEGG
jgi:hypothetical protein